ncbi:hypothetical protein NL676_018218 [Syzygium grande]|nr:hypothetical protein NL676_018218 [Syzygium grande]
MGSIRRPACRPLHSHQSSPPPPPPPPSFLLPSSVFFTSLLSASISSPVDRRFRACRAPRWWRSDRFARRPQRRRGGLRREAVRFGVLSGLYEHRVGTDRE